MDDVEPRERRVAAQREGERVNLLHAQLAQRHVRQRAVTTQAAGEQAEGLDVLELGARQVELARVDLRLPYVIAAAVTIIAALAAARLLLAASRVSPNEE